MINYKPFIYQKLDELGYPVVYESIANSDTELPCITFIETDNNAGLSGDTIEYSGLSFTIKVWGKDIMVMSQIASQIDVVMREIGFKRTFANELFIDDLGQKIMRYTATAFEKL